MKRKFTKITALLVTVALLMAVPTLSAYANEENTTAVLSESAAQSTTNNILIFFILSSYFNEKLLFIILTLYMNNISSGFVKSISKFCKLANLTYLKSNTITSW